MLRVFHVEVGTADRLQYTYLVDRAVMASWIQDTDSTECSKAVFFSERPWKSHMQVVLLYVRVLHAGSSMALNFVTCSVTADFGKY